MANLIFDHYDKDGTEIMRCLKCGGDAFASLETEEVRTRRTCLWCGCMMHLANCDIDYSLITRPEGRHICRDCADGEL